MDSVSLQMCYSNASYNKNTLINDAILRTTNPSQSLHITTSTTPSDPSLITLSNNKVYIRGDLEVSGKLMATVTGGAGTGGTIIPELIADTYYIGTNITSKVLGQNISANSVFIGYVNDGEILSSNVLYVNELYSGTVLSGVSNSIVDQVVAESFYINSDVTSNILGQDISTTMINIGNLADGETLSSNALYTNDLFVDTGYYTYNPDNIPRGYTFNIQNVPGSASVDIANTTGQGKYVLNINPIFDGSIYATPKDNVLTPGYSWSGVQNKGIYNADQGIGFTISGQNVATIGTMSSQFIGDCAATTFTQTSDIRIKNDIKCIYNALDTVDKLSPQIYNKMQGTSSVVESGLIAQELYYDAPELRHLLRISADANIPNDEWGTVHARINYIGIIPYLVKSIQELKNNIEMKEQRILDLDKKNLSM